MPLFPLENLFKQAEANPKLMDELLSSHMFDYHAEKYYRWADCLREYYPELLAAWEELRYQVIGSDTASAHRAYLEETGADICGERCRAVQLVMEMHNYTMRKMIKEVEEEIVKRGIRDY